MAPRVADRADVVIEAIALGASDVFGAHDVEGALVELVARALPGVPELRGRWYWDSRPDAAVVARAVVNGARVVVGVRFAVYRAIDVAGARFDVVGTGIAVDPAWQRRGIGVALTSAFLAQLVDDRHAAVIAFLTTENALPLLQRFGFAQLHAPITTVTPGGETVPESAPCFVKELHDSGFVDAASAGFHVGRAW